MNSFVFLTLTVLSVGVQPMAQTPARDKIADRQTRVETLEYGFLSAHRDIPAPKRALTACRSADRTAEHAMDSPDQAAKDLERLQGEWTIIFVIERDGKERETSGSGAFSIKGDQIQQWNEGFALGVSGKITFDPSKKPAHIDIVNERTRYLGIYEFTDRGPVLMLSNEGGQRPKEFLPAAPRIRDDQGKMILKRKRTSR
jgi:uncharacterized protein (TIGR03067 family)